jgi:hypothetical protein
VMIYTVIGVYFVTPPPLIDNIKQSSSLFRFEMNSNAVFAHSSLHQPNDA